jgi:hypothetical protein
LVPIAVDRERQTVTFSANEAGKSSLPSFIKFKTETNEFIFSPTKLDIEKAYSIQLNLTDSFDMSSSLTFKVTIHDS